MQQKKMKTMAATVVNNDGKLNTIAINNATLQSIIFAPGKLKIIYTKPHNTGFNNFTIPDVREFSLYMIKLPYYKNISEIKNMGGNEL